MSQTGDNRAHSSYEIKFDRTPSNLCNPERKR